jgi:prephenate dehydratase
LIPATTTGAALASVRRNETDAACVPIENSIEGGVPAVLDALIAGPPLVIIREVQIAVQFALMARPGTEMNMIRTVGTHPHGEAQTRHWMGDNLQQASVVMTSSTAEAAAQVARGELDAAVSAPVAAAMNGLKILAGDIADNAAALTRFVLVRPPCAPPEPTGADRTSVAVTTKNQPGALVTLLTELSMRSIDLTRVESRPTKDRRDSYWFHLDCAGHVAEPAMGEAIAALKRRCDQVRYLGSYARSSPPDDPASSLEASGIDSAVPEADKAKGDGGADFNASFDWLRRIRSGTIG